MKEMEYEFYAIGRNKNINFQEWYEFNIKLYQKLNMEITHIVYTHSKREDSQYRNFARMRKKVEKDLQSDVQFNNIGFTSTPKQWRIISNNSNIMTQLYMHIDGRFSLSFYSKNISHLLNNVDAFISLAEDILHAQRSEIIKYSGSYGINYWAKDENKMLPGYIEKTFEHFEVLKKIKYNPKEEKNKKGCKLL